MTEAQKAYIAVIIDADGCVTVNKQTQAGKNYHYFRIDVTNTNKKGIL